MSKMFKLPIQVIKGLAIQLFNMSESIYSPKKTCSHFAFQHIAVQQHNIDQDREIWNEEDLRLARNAELPVVSVNHSYHTPKERGNVRVQLLEKGPLLLT